MLQEIQDMKADAATERKAILDKARHQEEVNKQLSSNIKARVKQDELTHEQQLYDHTSVEAKHKQHIASTELEINKLRQDKEDKRRQIADNELYIEYKKTELEKDILKFDVEALDVLIKSIQQKLVEQKNLEQSKQII